MQPGIRFDILPEDFWPRKCKLYIITIMKAYHNHCSAMNTRFDMVLANVEQKPGDMAFHKVQKELARLENKLSCFLENSDIGRVNKSGKNYPVNVGEETYNIISSCVIYNKLTAGAFDITCKPLIDLWESEGEITNNVIEKYMSLLGVNKIQLHPDNFSLELSNNTVKIDLGGYAKGYAMNKILVILDSCNIENAFVSFGDSSISVLGKHPHGDYWPAAIKNIFKPELSAYEFALINQSLSTSGSFQKQSKHIISPLTGHPVYEQKTVSFVSSCAVEAEVLSTAMLATNSIQKEIITKNFPACNGVEVLYNKTGIEKITEFNKTAYEFTR